VCTYNERANIERLINAIHDAAPSADILVMDDASPDGTSIVVEKAIENSWCGKRLKLKVRSGKLGLGSAIRDGLQIAIADGYDFVINLDADFSHDPTAIPELLAAMKDSTKINHDEQIGLVIGSRYVKNGGLVNCSWKRKFVSKSANTYARLLLGWNINDCSSAYRCYRVASLRRLPWSDIQCNGYGFLEEILWHILNPSCPNGDESNYSRPRVVEVPIIYTEREFGSSKISFSEATGTLDVLHKLWRLRRTKSVSKNINLA
jgi:dolichol-phosphate mannosyltransferase